MNDTDKVIIALGFFTVVGFIAYLYFLKIPNPTTTPTVSLEDVKNAKATWTYVKR